MTAGGALAPGKHIRLRVTGVLAVLLAGLACADRAPSSRQADAPAIWHKAARVIDLTVDGRADTVRLEARGTVADSLAIVLTILVDGKELHHEAWGSSYELALADSTVADAPSRDAWLRARLDTVLAGLTVDSLDAPGAHLMAEDSAILAGLEPRPAVRISFSYGYETTVRLVWDEPRRRFIRLWSCC